MSTGGTVDLVHAPSLATTAITRHQPAVLPAESSLRPQWRRDGCHQGLRLAAFGGVADPADGADDLRTGGVGFDLGPQSLDMGIDQALVVRVVRTPHLLQQRAAAEDLSRSPRQSNQQIELQRRQLYRLTITMNAMCSDVDDEITDP